MPLAPRSFDDKQESIDGMLRQLLGHGLLTIDVICAGDLPHIAGRLRAGLAARWTARTRAPRGLRGRRSSRRLGVPIATADADVPRIARFRGVQAITAETFAAAIAA